MDLVVYDDREQRYVPLLVALCAALLVGVLVAGLAFFLARDEPAEQLGQVTPPQAGAQQEPTSCAAALEEADAALAIATRLELALTEQTRVMDELLARRLTEQQALDRALPPLTGAAKDRQALRDAMTTYRQAREAC